MTNDSLIAYFQQHHPDLLETIRLLVTQETPSHDKPRLDAFAALLAARLTDAGATVEIVDQPARGNHLRARFVHGASTEKPALVLCHYDTVWPVGALATHPFRIEAGKAYGPGIFDMQSSLALVEYGLRAVRDLDIALPRPITVLITSDEEIGSGSSRVLIEEEARRAAYVLVMESPLPGGVLKTARKGTGTFTVETIGRAAHAGVDPDKGVNAIKEMAHQVLAIHALADREAGTTLSAGMIEGGTATNVVPARAAAQIDVRVWTQSEAARLVQAMAALQPVLSGAQVNVTGALNRPPLEHSATAALFARVQQIGRTLGMELAEGSTGGGSDGNFTGALGVPTLDGLGVPGDGAHADHEHILVDEIAGRAALLVAMWKDLLSV
ncbi:M20 family metallopeptidase [Caldilinea sp.]|uniref:M20 family metallopeptidase n=1 Tax=Caldilinea sp. TaxID=2293560 RepID=UPI002C172B03|nr:M20 family metallopeptidase [Caldilinea sp.]HRA65002.1 M20 family metallopeptidase [Caldilinea sp.]